MTQLTAEAVDAFLAAPKVTASARVGAALMRWELKVSDAAIWRSRLDRQGVALSEGLVICVWNISLPRHWSFKIALGRTEIRRWDICSKLPNHRNPSDRPPSFPNRVTSSDHEHVWFPTYPGLECARPLAGLGGLTHQEVWERFCARMNIECTYVHAAPGLGEALTLTITP